MVVWVLLSRVLIWSFCGSYPLFLNLQADFCFCKEDIIMMMMMMTMMVATTMMMMTTTTMMMIMIIMIDSLKDRGKGRDRGEGGGGGSERQTGRQTHR